VKERSNGRLVYHHIQYMNAAEVKRLQEAIETEFGDAEGMVLDIRDGMGGLAHWQVMSLLQSRVRQDYKDKAILYMRYRNGRVIPDVFSFNPIGGTVPEEVSFKRPVTLIQNEVSRSDKEIFSYIFNVMGMGYRVGTPTAGGVIGGFPNRLVDGSNVVVSVQGWYTKEGTNLEGFRVPPDVYVGRSIEDWHTGRDPQLEKATEVLLAQLEGKLPLPRKETK
jgi:C-terminal processing protease CtpA/Prc